MHALSLQPASTLSLLEVGEVPKGSTMSPYATPPVLQQPQGQFASSLKRSRGAAEEQLVASGIHPERAAALLAASESLQPASSQYFWNVRGGGGGRGGHRGSAGRGLGGSSSREMSGLMGAPTLAGSSVVMAPSGVHVRPPLELPEKPASPPPPCWFCLSSPQVEKHLVVSIGEECYLALPKGGVSDTHVLIVPTEHCASFATAPVETRAELGRFLASLRAYYFEKGLQMVAFERVLLRREPVGRGGGGAPPVPLHTQMQCVGVPAGMAPTAGSAFITEGKYKGVDFIELGEGETLEGVGVECSSGEYFYVEAPKTGADGSQGIMRLLHRVSSGAKHPLQFGREVICRILEAPEKLQWKSCVAGLEGETAQTLAFREAFKQHDFTLTL